MINTETHQNINFLGCMFIWACIHSKRLFKTTIHICLCLYMLNANMHKYMHVNRCTLFLYMRTYMYIHRDFLNKCQTRTNPLHTDIPMTRGLIPIPYCCIPCSMEDRPGQEAQKSEQQTRQRGLVSF